MSPSESSNDTTGVGEPYYSGDPPSSRWRADSSRGLTSVESEKAQA